MKFAFIVLSIVLALQSAPAQAGIFDKLFSPKEDNATEQLAPEHIKAKFGGTIMTGRDLLYDMQDLQGSFAAVDPMLSLDKLLTPTEPAATQQQAQADAPVEAAAQKPENAFLNVLTSIFKSKSSGSSWGSLGQGITDAFLDQLITEVSFKALDIYFSQLTGKSDVLDAVEVEVPDTSKMSVSMTHNVHHMAALLVAMKAAGRVIAEGNRESKTAKLKYKEVMALREEAAGMLVDGMRPAADGQTPPTALAPRAGDQPFLEQFAQAKREDMVKDTRVQDLALELWSAKDPVAYDRYTLAFSEMKGHYTSYTRTTMGTASMIGLSALYIKKLESLIKKNGAASAVVYTPLIEQGLSEMFSLVPKLMHFGGEDSEEAGSFALDVDGKNAKGDVSAEKIFGALDEASKAAFQSIWIADQEGLLATLDATSPESAADIADRLITPETKKILAKQFAPEQGEYSFQRNVLGKVGDMRKYRAIAGELFTRNLPPPDKDCVGNTKEQALRLAQRDLREGATKLRNRDLRRIAMARSEDPRNPARPIALGKSVIRVDKMGMGGLVDQQAMREDRQKVRMPQPAPQQPGPKKQQPKGKKRKKA
jgi:hypothetical protein